jgi:hypothetical protein
MTKESKKASKKATPKEVVEATPTEMSREDILALAERVRVSEDVEFIRSVVCKFYRDGGCPWVSDPDVCNACIEEDAVLQCKYNYLSKIFTRPQEKWTPEFEAPLTRPKVKQDELQVMGLKCDSCYMYDKCPLYQKNSLCSIDWSIEDDSTKGLYDKLIRLQAERVNKAKAIEDLDGGIPDETLSREMDRLSSLLQGRANATADRFSLSASFVKGNQDSGQPKSILAEIFGDAIKPALPPSTATPLPQESKIEETEFTEVKNEDNT